MTGILIAMTAVVLLALCLLGRWREKPQEEYPSFYDRIYPVGNRDYWPFIIVLSKS